MADAGKFKIAEQLFKTGSNAITQGNLDYAIDCFLKCTRIIPEHLPYRQALRATEKKKYNGNGTGAKMAGIKMKPAQLKLKAAKARKKWKEVIEAGEDALTVNPWDANMLLEVGNACHELVLVETGTWVLETAAEVDKETAELYRLLARLYEKGEKFDKAINSWEMVRKLDPTDSEATSKARQLAASETIQKGKLADEEAEKKQVEGSGAEKVDATSPEERAKKELASLLEKHAAEPENVPLCVQIAETFQKQKPPNYEKAAEFFQKGVELTGGRDPEIKTQLLNCQIEPYRIKLAQVQEQIKNFDKTQPDAAEKGKKVKVLYNAVSNEIRKREIELFKYKVDVQPSDSNSHIELGYRYLQNGELDESIKSLQQGRNDPRRKWQALLWLGMAFWKKKNVTLADKNLRDAEEAIPHGDEEATKEVLYRRGCLAQERGEKAEAVEHFNNIAAIDYGYKDVSKRLDELNE